MGARQWVLGGLLIVIGMLLLAKNFDIMQVEVWSLISTYWPVLLILFGLEVLVKGRDMGQRGTGIVLILLGVLLQGQKLGWFTLDLSFLWKMFWPVVIILIGISFLRGPKPVGKSKVAFMGGMEHKKQRWTLDDGDYWAVMGGIELDLRQAVLEKRTYQLTCSAIMGGMELVVPKNLRIDCSGTAVLGGLEFLGESTGGIIASLKASQVGQGIEEETRIVIDCRAIMGGISIQVKEDL